MVLPNGPEMAVAILARGGERDVRPDEPGLSGRGTGQIFCRSAASCVDHAGRDRLAGAPRGALARRPCRRAIDRTRCGGRSLHAHRETERGAPSHEPVSPGDVALLLFTSGTTSRPKIVPLTHANICTSAYSSVAALALSRNRSLLERAAAVSWAWSHRHGADLAGGRRERRLHAGL